MSQALFDEADHLEEDGNFYQAICRWRELAASDPTRNVYLRLGGCAKDQGFTKEAEEAFTRALECNAPQSLPPTFSR